MIRATLFLTGSPVGIDASTSATDGAAAADDDGSGGLIVLHCMRGDLV